MQGRMLAGLKCCGGLSKMVEVQQITKTLMLSLYAENLVYDLVNTGDRIFAKTRAQTHDTYKTVVYCLL